ncbi:hypothetical protein MMC26_005185 [Xylographa opegraphella]|nr:hypothetical protein [Xylographa opegraphella]
MQPSTTATSKRRRFAQPTTINNYFFPSTHHPSAPTDAISPSGLLSPSLPADVQASLLQVGMRVRKSIPEGYKTIAPTNPTATKASPTQATPSKPTTSELTPFCGIHKVGGYGYQLHAADDDNDAESIFPSSQESSTSSMAPPASPPTTKKRGWSVGSDDLVENINAFRGSMSPPPLRPLAQPKTRVRRSPRSNAWGGCEHDVMEWDDFEEAHFLQPLEKWGPGTCVPFG